MSKRQGELPLSPQAPGELPALLRGPSNMPVNVRMSDGYVITIPMKYMAELAHKLNRYRS